MTQPSDTPAAAWSDPASSPGTDHADHLDHLDAVEALRAELDSIRESPVADSVARFEQANAVLVAALAELDEV